MFHGGDNEACGGDRRRVRGGYFLSRGQMKRAPLTDEHAGFEEPVGCENDRYRRIVRPVDSRDDEGENNQQR